MHTPSEGNGRGKKLKMLQIPRKKTVEARIHSDPLGEKCHARHACFRFQFYRLMIIEWLCYYEMIGFRFFHVVIAHADAHAHCDRWRVSGKVIIWVRMWMVIQSPPCILLGWCRGKTDRNHPIHRGCHAFWVRVVGADPWATWFLGARSCSNSQRPPDHSHTCWN